MSKNISNKLAWHDSDFLDEHDNISLRVQIELQRTYSILQKSGIQSTIAVFGSARCKPESKEYENTVQLCKHLSTQLALPYNYKRFVIATGGGPGLMEAANKGAWLSAPQAKSIGFSIQLPFETHSNQYVSPEYDFLFKYFMIRKFHIVKNAAAFVACQGGVGTFDEIFEVITLMQTGKMPIRPIVMFGKDYWKSVVNWELLKESGMVSQNDFDHILFTDCIYEATNHISNFYVAIK